MLNIMKTRARTVTQNRFLRRLMLHFDYLQDETGSMHQASTVIFLLANLYIQAVPTNTRSDSCLNGILGSSKWVPAILVLGLVTPLLVICLLATSLFFEDSLIDNRNNLQTPAHLKSHWYRIYKHLYRFNFLLLEPIVSGYMISLILTVSKDDDSDYGIGFTICAIIGGILGLILNLTYLFFVESILPNDSITSGTNRVNIALTTLALRMCLALDRYFTYIDSQAVRAVIMSIRLIPSVVAMQVNLFSTYFFNRSARLFFSGYQISNIIYSITVFIEGGSSYAITIIPASLFIVLALRWVYNVDLLEKSNLRNPSTSRLLDVISLSGYLFYKQNGLEDLASVPGLNFQAVMAHRTDNRFVQYEEFIEKFASAEERTEDDEKNAILFVTYMYERLWHETGEKNFKVLVYEMMWALTMRPNLLHLSILLARFNTLEMNPVQQSTYRSVVRKLETICKEIYLDKQSLLPIKEQFYAPKSVAEINESVAFKQKMNINDDDSKDGAENAKQTSSTGKSDLLHFDVYSSMQTIEQYERLVGKMQEVISTILKFYDKLKNRVVEIASAHETMKTVKQLKESVSKSFRDLDRLSGEQNLFHLLPYALFLETINNDRQASQKILKVFEHRSQVVQRNLIMARDRSSYTKFNLDLMLCIGVDCTKNSLGRMNYVSSNCEEVFGVQPKNFEGRNVNSLMSDDFQTIHDEFMDKFVKDQDKPYLGVSRERHVRIREQIYTKCDVLVKLAPVLNPTSLSFMCLLKRHTSDEEFIVLNHQGVIVGRSQGLDWAGTAVDSLLARKLSSLSPPLDKLVKSVRASLTCTAVEANETCLKSLHRSVLGSLKSTPEDREILRYMAYKSGEFMVELKKTVRDDPERYWLNMPEDSNSSGRQMINDTTQDAVERKGEPVSYSGLKQASAEFREMLRRPTGHLSPTMTGTAYRLIESGLRNLSVSLRTTTWRQKHRIVYMECWLMTRFTDPGSRLLPHNTSGNFAIQMELSRSPSPQDKNLSFKSAGGIFVFGTEATAVVREITRPSSSLSVAARSHEHYHKRSRIVNSNVINNPVDEVVKFLPELIEPLEESPQKAGRMKLILHDLAVRQTNAPLSLKGSPRTKKMKENLQRNMMGSYRTIQTGTTTELLDSESGYFKIKMMSIIKQQRTKLGGRELIAIVFVLMAIWYINIHLHVIMRQNFIDEMTPRIEVRSGLEMIFMGYARLFDVGRLLMEMMLVDQSYLIPNKYVSLFPWYKRDINRDLQESVEQARQNNIRLLAHVTNNDWKYSYAFEIKTYDFKYNLSQNDLSTLQHQTLNVVNAPRATLYETRRIYDSILDFRKELSEAKVLDPQVKMVRPGIFTQDAIFNYFTLMSMGWGTYAAGTVSIFIDVDQNAYSKLINRATLISYFGIVGSFLLVCGIMFCLHLVRKRILGTYFILGQLYEYEMIFYTNKLTMFKNLLTRCGFSHKHGMSRSAVRSLAVCNPLYELFKEKYGDSQLRLRINYRITYRHWFGFGFLAILLFIIIQAYTVTSLALLRLMSEQSNRKLELMTYHRRIIITNGVLGSVNCYVYMLALQKSGLGLPNTNFTFNYNFEKQWTNTTERFTKEIGRFLDRDVVYNPETSSNLLEVMIQRKPCEWFRPSAGTKEDCKRLAAGNTDKNIINLLRWHQMNNERLLTNILNATKENVLQVLVSEELLSLELLRNELMLPFVQYFTRGFYSEILQLHEETTVVLIDVLLRLLVASIILSLAVSGIGYFKILQQVSLSLECMNCIPFESYQHNLYVSAMMNRLERK